jgi:hypothetical protein
MNLNRISPQKKKKKKLWYGIELATYQSQIGKSTNGQLSILAKKIKMDLTNRKHQSGETSK